MFEIDLPDPAHLGLRQTGAAPETLPGWAFGVGREAAIDQQHETERGLAGIAQRDSRRQRQIGPGRIAADGEPLRIDAEAIALASREVDHREHFLKGHREAVLRGQLIVDRQRGNPTLTDELAQHRIPAWQAALHKPAAMRVDHQRRPFGIVRQIEAARHLAVRTRQAQIPLMPERDGAFAEKRSDAISCGTDLAQRRLRAVRRDEAAALQQLPRSDELGSGLGCRVIHNLSPMGYSAARAGSAAGVDVAAGRRGKTSFAKSLIPFSASWWPRNPERPM